MTIDPNLLKGLAASAGKDIAKGQGVKLDSTLSWGATGATVGSAVPLIGTAIGGAVGGVAGFFADNSDWLGDKFGSSGGNTGQDYPYMEPWRYAIGGPSYRKPYEKLGTNKNYFNSDFKGGYEKWANMLGVDLKQLVYIFETVMVNDKDFFYKNQDLGGDWSSYEVGKNVWLRIAQKFSQIKSNEQSTNMQSSLIIQKSNGFNAGNVLKDTLLGGLGSAAGAIDKELKGNKDYEKVKSDVIDTGAKNALWATLKNYWYVAPIIIVLYFIIKKK